MTSKSSKALPYLATTILILSLGAEVYYNVEIDLETALPFLMSIGLGGAGLKAVERAAKARNAIPSDIENLIKTEMKKGIDFIDAKATARIDEKLPK